MHKIRYLSPKEENRVELVRNISANTYESLRKQINPLTEELVKKVITFLWTVDDSIYIFLIETFKVDNDLVSLVSISTDDHNRNDKYSIPPFLNVEKDVTGNLNRRQQILDL